MGPMEPKSLDLCWITVAISSMNTARARSWEWPGWKTCRFCWDLDHVGAKNILQLMSSETEAKSTWCSEPASYEFEPAPRVQIWLCCTSLQWVLKSDSCPIASCRDLARLDEFECWNLLEPLPTNCDRMWQWQWPCFRVYPRAPVEHPRIRCRVPHAQEHLGSFWHCPENLVTGSVLFRGSRTFCLSSFNTHPISILLVNFATT